PRPPIPKQADHGLRFRVDADDLEESRLARHRPRGPFHAQSALPHVEHQVLHRAAAGRVILAFPQRIAAPRARDDEKRRNRAPAPPARFGRGVPFRGPLDFDREIDDRGGRAFSDHVETPRFRKAVIRRPAGQLDGFEETLRAGRLGLEQIDRTARSDQLRKVGEAFWTVAHRIPSNTLPTRRQPAILAAEVRAKTVRRGMDYWLAAHSTGQDE